MNRRRFLVLFAAAACGPPRRPRPKRNSTGSGEPDDYTLPGPDDWSNARSTRREPSSLAVRGDMVVYAAKDGLVFVDATTLAQVDKISAQYRGYCFLRDGTLAAIDPSNGCELDLIKKQHIDRSLHIPDCGLITGRHLVAGAASDLYVRHRESLVHYQFSSGTLVEERTIELGIPAQGGADQIVVLGDGRLIVPAGRTLQVYGSGPPTPLPTTHSPSHVAVGAGPRIWYSTRGTKGGEIDQVVLARLQDFVTVESTLSFAPSRITHMASGETGGLAVVLNTVGEKAFVWTIVVLDEKGSERRRIVVDDDIAKQVDVDLNVASVALTAHSVVLHSERHGLFGWNAANGARIR